MLLKRLSLVGFKSFADRTRLEFDAGVNVVVGPNGTGKSNLLDAVAWVMGTQATRSLRTEKMEDVVFAGTVTRPALSRAEVALTFDNAERFLPLDLAEITITRRLYRDGTSEYELNGARCRLLDIQDLLFDGGVGRHQHVLVGQGEIGLILNARPDEHRAVIEEAAGITKHRGRRDRSLRRLEQTSLDVERLNDILREKRRLLRPLKRQANAAERHDRVREERHQLRLWMGGEELRDIRIRRAVADQEHAGLEARSRQDQADLALARTEADELRATTGETGTALERDTAAAARLETVTERLRRIASVARERRLSIIGRMEGTGQRRSDLAAEEAELGEDIAAGTRAEADAKIATERREVALQALADEERALAEQVGLPAEGLVANLRGDLRSLETAAERDRREAEALTTRRKVLTDRLADETDEGRSLNASIRETDALVTAVQVDYETARVDREEQQAAWEHQEEETAHRRIAAAAATARVEAFTAALSGLGDPDAVDHAATAPGIVGSIVAGLDVPVDVAPAVDATLGIWGDAFYADGLEPVRRVAESLKARGLGGVTLLGDASSPKCPAREAAAEFGLEALVDRLGPRSDADLAAALIGDVVLVEGWEAGWAVVARFPDLRAATPEGDVISGFGMVVAQPDGVGPAAVEAASVARERADAELARADSLRTVARRGFDATRERERAMLENLEAQEARLAGHTEALALVGRARAETEAELIRLKARQGSLVEATAARDERLGLLRSRVAELEGEEQARQTAWDALNRRRDEVAVRRDEARRLREEAAAQLVQSVERKRLLEDRTVVVRAEIERLDASPGGDDGAIERLASVESRAAAVIEVVRRHVAALRERQRELRERLGATGVHLGSVEQRRDDLEAAVSDARDRLAVLAVEIAELRVREEAAAEALRRDADATEDEALAAPVPDLGEGIDAAERLATVEADLRRMGPINPLAAAEHAELAAEVAMLVDQIADLDESRSELGKVIAALDDEMAELFRTAFAEISRLYEEHFSLVFPGGRGRLRLVNPERPLESGVEVEAQPHGKKVGRLSLLSGGERSLAALAFLFAVFRARPSPFYILDEVEAALDDANLHRFLRLVDTLRNSAQLVIITHQQQTMGAADILYGVTMEPGASSKVLAKRMTRATV